MSTAIRSDSDEPTTTERRKSEIEHIGDLSGAIEDGNEERDIQAFTLARHGSTRSTKFLAIEI